MTEKDYSGTPLWTKLGIKEGSDVFVGAAPYPKAPKLAPFPAGVKIRRRPGEGSIDVIVFFVTDGARLEHDFYGLALLLRADGGFWVVWPKKSSRIENDLSFEVVQRIGLGAGLVDNKSAAIDAHWQGLRFVVRREDRASWPHALRRPTTR